MHHVYHTRACVPMSDSRLLHRILRRIARLSVESFFTELRVIGGENVPKDGPIIVYVYAFIIPYGQVERFFL